jgi:hypothetical protein
MAYSVLRKDGKIKDFIQGVKDKRASKNVKFTDVIDTARLKQGGGLKDKFAKYATLENRPFRQSTKITYSVPRAEFKADKEWKGARREARAMKLGKLAMTAGLYGMLTAKRN